MGAKEMFESLGFRMILNNKDIIEYADDDYKLVVFYKNLKGFFCHNYPVTMPILKAINKQIEELRWLDE